MLVAVCAAMPATSQTLELGSLFEPRSGQSAGRIIQILLVVTVLSLGPGLLMMVTCFPRFVVALAFLRSGIGMQTTPSNMILINLALFMTWLVMAPTFERAWQAGMKPLMNNEIGVEQAVPLMTRPFQDFMKSNVREADLKRIQTVIVEKIDSAAALDADDLRILIPAFMISELRRGFEIGFLIALPFLVIDMIVASVVMSMGMMMMSPVVFSLPLKVLFFVLVDGWGILVTGLLRSFA